MLRHGTWLVPTLVAPQGVLDAADAGVQFSPGVLDKARPWWRSTARPSGARSRPACGSRWAPTRRCRRTAQNLRELALMAELGMTPAAVLEATTRSAAQLLGVDDERGTIEPGKVADLVLVGGDPYAFDSLPDRIDGVWLGGRRAI